MINFRKKELNDVIDIIITQKAKNLAIIDMAIEDAKNMIAKTIAKSEFKIYKKGEDGKVKETRDKNYYRLNIMPNPNETATIFWINVINKLFDENEALIVFLNGYMYLAESFIKDEFVLTENNFHDINVIANGITYKIAATFKRNQVLYFENKNEKIKRLVEIFNTEYGELISLAKNSYKYSNVQKFSMQMPAQVTMLKKKDGTVVSGEEYTEDIKNKIKSDDIEVIMSGLDIKPESLSKGTQKTADDITKFTDLAISIVAFAFDIPIDVFYGKTTEKSNAQNDFITFSIEPIVEIINDGCNSSLVEKNDFLDGESIEIDKSSFKHYDILDVATNLDKLFAIGFSHNDVCRMVGLREVDEEWANEHNITKNYGNAKGGGKE